MKTLKQIQMTDKEDKSSKPLYIPSPIRMTNIENGIVEPEIRKENPPVIPELSPEVKQALENLKILNKKCDDYLKLVETAVEMLRDTKTKLALEACLELIITFVNEQKNLINALDKQFGGEND